MLQIRIQQLRQRHAAYLFFKRPALFQCEEHSQDLQSARNRTVRDGALADNLSLGRRHPIRKQLWPDRLAQEQGRAKVDRVRTTVCNVEHKPSHFLCFILQATQSSKNSAINKTPVK